MLVQVEDELYSIPRKALCSQSEVFQGMFMHDNPEEGRTDDNPIVLEGYKRTDFESLLRVIIPELTIMARPLEPSPPLLDKAEWISVLKLATIWQMDKIRKISIEKLSLLDLSPSQKISLAREHRVASWLKDGARALVEGFQSSQLSEIAAELGWETTARILAIRDSTTVKPNDSICLGDLCCVNCIQPMNTFSNLGMPTCNRYPRCSLTPEVVAVRPRGSGSRIPILATFVCGSTSCGLGTCSPDTFRCTVCDNSVSFFKLYGPAESASTSSATLQDAVERLFGDEIKELEDL
ncbi:hypothetical protein BKA70DRAFT_1103803 [Coprinopsis sp. MPI-PUGE-AT-0042]|nr:hypothetical protein BKA70DRAFT_1103803 [Coprinopsis sp. MPI-PUGE-AT-0042]